MVSKLERLSEVRNAIKVQLAELTDDIHCTVSELSAISCRSKLEELLEMKKEFTETHNQIILAINKKENFSEHIGIKKQFDKDYYEIRIVILTRLDVLKESYNRDSIVNGNNDDQTSNHSGRNNSKSNFTIKLPRISLPNFTGKIDEWTAFYDLFIATVHKNDKLSDIEKFQYLVASLKQDALKVIRAIPLKDENYEQALKILKSRYQNERLLAQTHANAIINLKPLKDNGFEEVNSLVDDIRANIRSLEVLGYQVNDTDPVIIQLILRKLTDTLKNGWFAKPVSMENPTWSGLLQYLDQTAIAFRNTQKLNNKFHGYRTNTNVSMEIKPGSKYCYACSKSDHFIFQCESFKKMSIDQRSEVVHKNKLCFNCLRLGHRASDCRSRNCKSCDKKHNSWLHRNTANQTSASSFCSSQDDTQNQVETSSDKKDSGTSNRNNENLLFANNNSNTDNILRSNQSYTVNLKNCKSVMLATAVVYILDCNNRKQKVRVLLDTGSMANLITRNCVKHLGLSLSPACVDLRGISNVKCNVNASTHFVLFSRLNNYRIEAEALVLDEVTGMSPITRLPNIRLPIRMREMADPWYHTPGPIDLILGAQNVLGCFKSRPAIQLKAGPFLKDTVFGYVLSGEYSAPKVCTYSSNYVIANSCILTDLVKQFWQIENVPDNVVNVTQDEKICEKFYAATITRNVDGRFIARLPFKRSPELLGESRKTAVHILYSVLSKLSKSQLTMYHDFMNEYCALGHMYPVQSVDNERNYYMPHHAIFKEKSSTSKIRVVFNASKPSSTNVSLNDILHVGPTIQNDLFSILLRFRSYLIAVAADIEKMYRQVLIHPEDTKYQRIVWLVNDQIKDFELQTVTYGTAPAAFLAIRSLQEIAKIESKTYPLACARICDFYVDDLLTGADTIEDAVKLVNEMYQLLQKACFSIRKWTSNKSDIFRSCFNNIRGNCELLMNDKEQASALGIIWNNYDDLLQLNVTLPQVSNVTKRKILSEVAKLFDPLGLIAPVIVLAKLIIRDLWISGIEWDQSPSENICNSWLDLRARLINLHIHIPRPAIICKTDIELHGFADASEKAYAACFYVKSHLNNNVIVRLLCAKTRIAPLKLLTIPRLELCAAYLLSQLYLKIKDLFVLDFKNTYFWTDSQIVLAWLSKDPGVWKQFVATRSSAILRATDRRSWRHIESASNPADVASRGLNPDLLVNNQLWWSGPKFLKTDDYSSNDFNNCDFEIVKSEAKKVKKRFVSYVNIFEHFNLFEKYSNLNKLIHVFAYCLRFIYKCKKNELFNFKDELNADELENAMLQLSKLIQIQVYSKDVENLKKKKCVSVNSSIAPLAPFLDENGILRVGGRLHKADISYARKHPILLPVNHAFVTLIIRNTHISLLHAGTASVTAQIREKFWIPRLPSRVRNILRDCMVCKRIKAKTMQQVMAPLPADRVNVSAPFLVTGVDLTGEFRIKPSSTKAVYIDVVSDRSTEAFLASFQWFISRRGRPHTMYSDHGTNFIGANNEWKKILESAQVQCYIAKENIRWQFITPSAPHHGGLWERAVKSTKVHLKKVVGDTILTFEELSTLCARVESCLNSRPLYASSNDPNDYEAITPGHFLVGRNLQIAPEPFEEETKDVRNRWKLLQSLNTCFWKRWSREYLHTLQRRYKWKRERQEPKIGDLVLIMDDTSSLKWKLGRVIDIVEKDEDYVRTVKLKTSNGEYIRPIVKLVPLLSKDGD